MSDADELLPVVDRHDVVQGVRSRGEIHRQGLLHRAVHVLVFNREGSLYLQRRSESKDTHPGKWTTSASGHVDPDEGYLEAAARELEEELGLSLALEEVGSIAANARTENEFTRVFRAHTKREPQPNPAEIVEGRWFGLDEARELAQDLERAAPSLGAVLDMI